MFFSVSVQFVFITMASCSKDMKRPLTEKELHQIAEEMMTNSDNSEWSGAEDVGNNDDMYIESNHSSESEMSYNNSDSDSDEHMYDTNDVSESSYFYGREKANKTKW